MVDINYSTRAFVDKRDNRVMFRVRWMNKQREVLFPVGVYALEDKWNKDLQRAKKSTTHEIRGMKFSASQINDAIAEYSDTIDCCFHEFSRQGVVPSTDQLKDMLHQEMARDLRSTVTITPERKSLKELFDDFLMICGYEKNWNRLAKEKYRQAFTHITSANSGLTPDNISIQTMYKLREWYVSNGYKNRTINKQTVMIKSFLSWVDQQEGYSIPSAVLEFSTNLKVIPRTVTFLKYQELMAFYHYPFQDEHLARARDLWCFMAFTSLRYSDLNALRHAHIIEGKRIEMFTQKTDGHISIPLSDNAIEIINKYIGKTKHGRVFPSIANQKLNDYVKEAAKEAGLDREIIDSYYIGTERYDVVRKYHDIISCHDARRTFVTCSLAMGIPPEVVMKCTGHSDYKTMKPYIETITETQVMEMEKWNRNRYRSQIIMMLDGRSEEDLKSILYVLRKELDQTDSVTA